MWGVINKVHFVFERKVGSSVLYGTLRLEFSYTSSETN